MPHLSPIHWTLFLTFLWITFSLITTTNFWLIKSKFIKPEKPILLNKLITWQWL